MVCNENTAKASRRMKVRAWQRWQGAARMVPDVRSAPASHALPQRVHCRHDLPLARRMLIQIGLIVLLSLLNGFFALSEMAVVASRKSRLKQMAHTSSRARVAVRLLQHPDRFLSTVQSGITLVVLVTGAIA
jgi:hypothetical protein